MCVCAKVHRVFFGSILPYSLLTPSKLCKFTCRGPFGHVEELSVWNIGRPSAASLDFLHMHSCRLWNPLGSVRFAGSKHSRTRRFTSQRNQSQSETLSPLLGQIADAKHCKRMGLEPLSSNLE